MYGRPPSELNLSARELRDLDLWWDQEPPVMERIEFLLAKLVTFYLTAHGDRDAKVADHLIRYEPPEPDAGPSPTTDAMIFKAAAKKD